MNACPSSETLEQLLAGTLTEREAGSVHVHIDQCPYCLALLDSLQDDADLRDWAADGIAPHPDLEREPGLARLLQGWRFEPVAHAVVRSRANGALFFLAPARRPKDLGTLDDYRVESELGRGSMGVVLKAYDETLQRTVALKILRPERADETSRARFVQEARAAARIKHENVVSIYTVVNPADTPPYLVMEYIAGPTLRELIRRQGRLEPREAAAICAQAADGLAAAHDAGLIHRDIKPSNILLSVVSCQASVVQEDRAGSLQSTTDRGELTTIAKITDFGLARVVAHPSGMTQEGVMVGTPAYMSPEQVRQPEQIDARTDIYSLGVTLYEALTGQEPFRGATHVVLQQVLHDEPLPPRCLNEAIPPALEAICRKAMANEPQRRYASARDLAEELRHWLRGEPIQARPEGPIQRLLRWCRRHPWAAALIGLGQALLLMLTAGSLLYAVRSSQEAVQAHRAQVDTELRREQSAADAQDAREVNASAVDALDKLVLELQEMTERAGTSKHHRQMLEKVLSELQRVAQRAGQSHAADRSLIVLYERMGDLLLLLGRDAEAQESYDRARGHAEVLGAANPEDVQAQRDVGMVYHKLGLFRHSSGAVEAAGSVAKALALRQALAQAHPGQTDIQLDLCASYRAAGDLEFDAGRWTAALEHYEQALALVTSLAKSSRDSIAVRQSFCLTYSRLTKVCVQIRELTKAKEYAQKSLALAEQLALSDPAHLGGQRGRLSAILTLGDVLLRRDEVSKTMELHAQARNLANRLASDGIDNGENLRARYQFSWHYAELRLRVKDLDAARVFFGQGAEMARQSLARDPNSVSAGLDCAKASLRLADVNARKEDYVSAYHSCHAAAEMLAGLEQEGKLQGRGGQRLLEESLARRAALWETARPTESMPSAPAAETACWSLSLRALAHARKGQHADAAAAAEQLRARAPERAVHFLSIARVYALGVKSAAEPALQGRYAAAALDALRRTLELDASCELHLEPDLDPVRPHPDYKTLLQQPDRRGSADK